MYQQCNIIKASIMDNILTQDLYVKKNRVLILIKVA